MSSKRFIALIILDGWGLSPYQDHNAIALTNTPTMDHHWSSFPNTTLTTFGQSVGLPVGLMGNSEVGHLNLGAGRTVLQAITQIDNQINDGTFLKNDALIASMDRIKKTNRNLHLIGLVSEGGVHSWPGHYQGLLRMAADRGLNPGQVFVHPFLDGRDTPPKSSAKTLRTLLEMFKCIGVGQIATMCGRYYAMDRDSRWDRTQRAYDCLTLGEGIPESNPVESIENAYSRGETDEFIKPIVLVKKSGKPIATVRNGDSILFFNFRGDRPRQITRAFVLNNFDGFKRKIWPNTHFTCLTRYEESIPVNGVAYPPETLSQKSSGIYGKVLSQAGKRQLRIAETEKYAHVTFFFNGQQEIPFKGEERILIPSPRSISTYDQKPEMSAPAITNHLVDAIHSRKFDTAVCNFANPDMVGHTGILKAAMMAIGTIDHCLGRVLKAIQEINGAAIITSDHGNAEQMRHYETGEPHTAHTTNPVPFIVVDPDFEGTLKPNGSLCDVAPTLLGLLGIPKPKEMTGEDLRC